MLYTVDVRVSLKKGVADPEGKNTKKALELLGFDVKGVSSSKVFTISVEADGEDQAEWQVKEMCRKLLANPVIHNYDIAFR